MLLHAYDTPHSLSRLPFIVTPSSPSSKHVFGEGSELTPSGLHLQLLRQGILGSGVLQRSLFAPLQRFGSYLIVSAVTVSTTTVSAVAVLKHNESEHPDSEHSDSDHSDLMVVLVYLKFISSLWRSNLVTPEGLSAATAPNPNVKPWRFRGRFRGRFEVGTERRSVVP